MKRIIRILALFIVIAMLSTILVGCAKTPLGKYTRNLNGVETIYEFKLFSRVVRTIRIVGESNSEAVVKEGKYKITQDQDNPEQLLITLDRQLLNYLTFSKICI